MEDLLIVGSGIAFGPYNDPGRISEQPSLASCENKFRDGEYLVGRNTTCTVI